MIFLNDSLRSYSTEHGIVYCANGGACLKVEKDGDKTNKYILERSFLEEIAEIPRNFNNPVGWEFLELIVLTALSCIVGVVTAGSKGLCYALFLSAFVYWQLIPIANMAILSKVLKKEEYVNLARNRGAEQKLQNAYTKKRGIPTIEEVKSASRIIKGDNPENHEYTRLIACIFYLVMLFIEYFIVESTALIVVAFIVYLVMVFKFHSAGSFLQLLTTMEPRDEDLELAVEGLEFLELYKTSTDQAFTEMSKSLEPVIDQMIEICEKQPDKLDDEIDIDKIKLHQLMIKRSAKGEFASERNLKNAAETVYFLYFDLLH